MKMNIKIKIILITALIITASLFAYNKFKSGQIAKPQYQTAKVERGSLIVSLATSGQVAATNSRTVTTTASGVVKKIFVKEGQTVKTGTPILEIDLDLNGRQKLQAAYSSYQSAQNSLKSAQDKIWSLESDLVGAKNVFENQWANQSPDDPTYIQKHNAYLTAQASYDNLKNTIKQSQASLESSRLSYQLAGATVYAPISGTVSAISLTPGMILNPTSDSGNSSNIENKIAIVKTNATPAITVSLTEIDVPKAKVGNKATITIDALPDKTFTGKIIAIDTAGIVSSGVVSYPTTIQLDSEAPGVLSNMSASANIITNFKDDVLIVPNSAVQGSGGDTAVRVMVGGEVQNKTIEIGIQSESQTEIIAGLNEGEDVVTSVTNSTTNTTTSTTTSPFGNIRGAGGGMIMRRD
ncbi:MAG: efflux RND transporter periplasmic adaptor subunit [Candidatus Shapirobacteria bacterium]|jgi:multidrug efflux pump subunit AcrA (membrane-fusion protein)